MRGLPRGAPPYLQALGLSTPGPWVHRGRHKTFYTEEDALCSRPLPGQACGAYPGGRRSHLTLPPLPSPPHHRGGPPWPLHPTPGTPPPPGDLGLRHGEGGGGRGGRTETVMDTLSSEASSAGPGPAEPPHLHSTAAPSRSFRAETHQKKIIIIQRSSFFINKLERTRRGGGGWFTLHMRVSLLPGGVGGKECNHRHEHFRNTGGYFFWGGGGGARRGARGREGAHHNHHHY